ncbi:hypothetical protein [Henriciella litoralis]|uniref:hypothetical protein n=1 Tax=Henriciella litoralis TaxID=568102 RepID=UPI0009FE7863|nr:hypothetical protein [Henriciella litoralis]
MDTNKKDVSKLKRVLSEIQLSSPDTGLEKAWKALGEIEPMEPATQSEELAKAKDTPDLSKS